MNVTPKTMARQIVTARAEAARKPVFTSETGVVRPVRVETIEIFEAFCFICSRATDHAGEHYDVAEYVTEHTNEWMSKDGTKRFIQHEVYVDRAEGPGMPWEECEKRMG